MSIRTHTTGADPAGGFERPDEDEATPAVADAEDVWDPSPEERAEIEAAIADADRSEPVPFEEVLAGFDRILAAYE